MNSNVLMSSLVIAAATTISMPPPDMVEIDGNKALGSTTPVSLIILKLH